MNKLQLPPGISVKRRGNAYAIFRNEYEEIGGVVVRGTSLGDTQLQPYVEEPQEKNRQIVALVAQQMSDALLVHVAKKPAHLRRNAFPPNNVSTGTEVFENKVFPCTKCNQIIARLVFSWESASVAASHGERSEGWQSSVAARPHCLPVVRIAPEGKQSRHPNAVSSHWEPSAEQQ
ncbi:hypothetical protein, partial [Thiolapillus sp.]|uniref:hypothetical protein n=5 Tax=Thiolapillus sp. TaxID=2017437 RepID=UPI003AF70834